MKIKLMKLRKKETKETQETRKSTEVESGVSLETVHWNWTTIQGISQEGFCVSI